MKLKDLDLKKTGNMNLMIVTCVLTKKLHVTTLPEPNYTSGVENAHQKCAKKFANKHANFLTFLGLYITLSI